MRVFSLHLDAIHIASEMVQLMENKYDFFSFLPSVPVERVCALPPKPANGDHFLVYGPNDVLIALQYLCHQPYELSGGSQRTCLPNNTWSGTSPVCIKGWKICLNNCRLEMDESFWGFFNSKLLIDERK